MARSGSNVSATYARISIPPIPNGVTWEGRYLLGEKLAETAASVVHEAEDTLLGRLVAVKELRGTALAPGTMVAQEARALAAVNHPGVICVYGVYPDATPPFLVMERARGRSLDAIMAAERLSLASALGIIRQVAAGLDALHLAGIAHGDVCPSNVIVDDGGCAKLVDVGVAAFVARMNSGELLGTPAYMPPERAIGSQTPSSVATLGDVYSFGVMCFEMLTGRLPFAASSTDDMLRAHVSRRPPMPSSCAGLSTEFDAPLARALAKRPDQRPATCTALAAALELASTGTDANGRRLRVLVADDDEASRMLLMTVLGAYLPGASVVLCGTGKSVLEAASTLPSVAVLDLSMPEPSGMELVRRVRELSPSTVIIIVTSFGSGADRQAARDLGVRRFLVKPFEVDELVLAIRDGAALPAPGAARGGGGTGQGV